MAIAGVDQPPPFCQYSSGPCDQLFVGTRSRGIFLYPSDPEGIAATIERAVDALKEEPGSSWLTWRDFRVTGQVIFCSISKSVRAKLRVLVKRILRKHGYPPDKQEKATQTVLEQAELISEEWG